MIKAQPVSHWLDEFCGAIFDQVRFTFCTLRLVLWNMMSTAETWRFAPAALWQRFFHLLHQHVNGKDEIATILQVTPPISAVKIFHPFNVKTFSKGLDITKLAAENFTKYLPNCFLLTATPLANAGSKVIGSGSRLRTTLCFGSHHFSTFFHCVEVFLFVLVGFSSGSGKSKRR